MDTKDYSISFIVPALNEQGNIAGAINSIHNAMRQLALNYDVVVVDNGSTDETVALAKGLNAEVFVRPNLNISQLRNFGVEQSCGSTLVFLDADVSLTPDWQSHFRQTLDIIEAGEKMITGSNCSPPESKNFLPAFWFKSLYEEDRNTHIGSAHMIVSRKAFDELGGFDASFSTGEDYQLCTHAKQLGYKIKNNTELKVIHHDFPNSLSRFVAREAWHGRSDYKNFTSWIGSKVAMAASLFLVLHVLLLAALVIAPKVAVSAAIAILILLFLSSFLKFKGQGAKRILVNAGIYYFYYIGRVAAMFSRVLNGVA